MMVVKGDEPHGDLLRNPGNKMVSPARPPVVGDDELQHVLVVWKKAVVDRNADDVPILSVLPFLQCDVPELQPLENPLPARNLPRVAGVGVGMGDARLPPPPS